MQSFREIIDLWPNRGEFGRDIGITQPYANTLHLRNALPAKMWNNVIEAAKKRGFKGVTLQVLAKLSERKKNDRA